MNNSHEENILADGQRRILRKNLFPTFPGEGRKQEIRKVRWEYRNLLSKTASLAAAGRNANACLGCDRSAIDESLKNPSWMLLCGAKSGLGLGCLSLGGVIFNGVHFFLEFWLKQRLIAGMMNKRVL